MLFLILSFICNLLLVRGEDLFSSTYKEYTHERVYTDYTKEKVQLDPEQVDILSYHDGYFDALARNDKDRQVLRELFSNVSTVVSDVPSLLRNERKQMEELKDETFFEDWRTLDEIWQWMDDLMKDNPDLPISSINIGTSIEGRSLLGLKIGTGPKHVFFFGGIHAREWLSPATVCWILYQLTQSDNNQLIEEYTWHIVPVANPDGYVYTLTDRYWRKNRRINNGNSPSCPGVDCNRNYQYGFGGGGTSNQPCSDIYRGTNYYSEPESKAIHDYAQSLTPNLIAFIDFHCCGNMFMTNYGNTVQLPSDYPRQYECAGKAVDAIRSINGRSYAYGSIANVIYVAAGGSTDSIYANLGVVYSYAVELSGSFVQPASGIIPSGRESWAGVVAMLECIEEE